MTSAHHTENGTISLKEGLSFLRAQAKLLPEKPGVYRMLALRGEVLYVGKAKNLKKRVISYTQENRLPLRLQRMVARTRGLEIVQTHTESEALLLEANLIKRHKPPYNVLLRDDKSFPFILLASAHAFPQILKHRGAKSREGSYFGPFASSVAVRETIEQIQRAFRIRTCADSFFAARKRPCLLYHIKRCSAPCVGKISQEAYALQVEQAVRLLSGKGNDLPEELAHAMQTASDALDFERAALLRDRIKALAAIQSKQDVHLPRLGDADIIALTRQGPVSALQLFIFRGGRHHGAKVYFPAHDDEVQDEEIVAAFIGQFYADKDIPPQILVNLLPESAATLQSALEEKRQGRVVLAVPQQGEKKRLVDSARLNAEQALARKLAQKETTTKARLRLAELFDLAGPPALIEVYDNSHTSGRQAVGAMIAAGPDGFLKNHYRKFTIQEAAGNDDFAMMQEVLSRRFKKQTPTPDFPPPDLVLIDGGAGQIAKVQGVIDSLGVRGVTVVGIAKGPDRNAGRERFFLPGREPFSLPPGDPALFYLQNLRDEAHRFAITTHRARRDKAMTGSLLDSIPGIGPQRRKALLHAFGSAQGVAAAGLDDLARTEGISVALAKKIYAFYHGGV